MSDIENKQDFSRYDAMTTEELEQILRADALITDEDDSYMELIVHIAEVYAERKKNEGVEAIKIPEPDFLCNTQPQSKKKQQSVRRFLRPLAAFAAIIVLVFCGTFSAKSMGYDIWGFVAEWTSSVFTFKSPTVPQSDTDPLDAIERMKPTWLPEGFELAEEKLDKEQPARYYALYEKGNASITITYQENVPNNEYNYSKSEGEIEIYEKNGFTFHIFKNIERTVTVWHVDGLTCHIGGDISTNEMKKVIDSIEQL